MPNIEQYSVSVKFKTEGADKTVNDTDKVRKSVSNLKSSTAGMKNLTSGFKTIGSGIGKVTKVFSAVAVAGVTMFAKLGKSAFNYSQQMSDYIEKVNYFKNSMGSLADEAEKFINRGELELGLNPTEMMDAISSFQNLSEGFGIASDRAYIMSKNLTQLSGDLSSFANISFSTAQKQLMSGFSGQVLPLRKYGVALDQASLQELAYSLGIDKRVKSMTRAQKTELIYYQIMTSLSKAQHDLGKTLMSPANALRVMKNEFSALGRAIGSIFIPLIQKTIPYIRMLTKILTQAASAIATFFGFEVKDYTASFEDVGGSLEGIADGVEDVGGAAEGTAKKLNKMLMPFDELNNISLDNKSGSGGGAGVGGLDGSSLGIELPEYDMFEIINDRVIKFGDVLGKAREGAHKLNEALASIDWDRIKEGARIAGESVAKFFNVGIEEIDWGLIGKTLAEGFNTALETAYGFVTTFNFKEAGKSIGDTINGLFNNIDWGKMAKGASEFSKGALNFISTAISNIDWGQLARDVQTYFSNMDWGGITEALFKAIGAAIGGIGKFIGTLISDGLEDTYDYFEEAVEKCGGNITLGIYMGIQTAMAKVGEWIKEHILNPFIEGFKNAFGIHSPSKVMEEQGQYIMEGLKIGIESFVSKIGETWDRIKETITGKIEEIKTKAEDIFQSLWRAILVGSQYAVNKCIDGFNKIIDGINQVGSYFGLHLEKIGHVTWADEFDERMKETAKTTDETGKEIVDSTGKTMDDMVKSTDSSLNIVGTNFSQTFAKIKQNTTGDLSQTETITKEKTEYIKNLITGNFGTARENAQKSTESIQKETENNLGKISSSSVFSRIKSSIETALNNSQKARELGTSTASNFETGLKNGIGSQETINTITSTIRNALNLGNSAFTWGQDMIEGFKRGINSVKSTLTNVVTGVADGIRRLMHFSRPDEGPLRDYETWMPDMIKGLSDSLLKATPILDSAVSQVSNMIAESLGNIVLPEINQSIYASGYNSETIRNIGNTTSNTVKDENTNNMIRATYEAVSRALLDNKNTDDKQPMVINIGNKEVYRGYAQYQDEQSNMLGVNI